jgi:alcohol dehydrogenase class IV
MSFAALTSGICLANAGLGVVHGFASSIGGFSHLSHGRICGTLMAKSNEVNIRELRKTGDNPHGLKKYAILGELFLGKSEKPDDYFIDGFADYLYKVSAELKLTGLGKPAFEEKDLDLICSKTEIKNNPVRLTTENLHEIAASVIQ